MIHFRNEKQGPSWICGIAQGCHAELIEAGPVEPAEIEQGGVDGMDFAQKKTVETLVKVCSPCGIHPRDNSLSISCLTKA